MTIKKYFTFREVEEGNPSRCIIIPLNYDTFPMNVKTGGSYAIAPARVLGLSWHQYLLFIMKSFPESVSVEGKGQLYPTPYWKKGKELYTFIDLLNARLTLAMKDLEMKNVRSTVSE